MAEPPFGERVGDGYEIVAMLERQMSVVAIAAVAAEPFGEEALLGLTLVGEIAAEQRPQQRVGLDAVVESVDERFDCSMASDAPKEIATGERAVRLRADKESTVLHEIQ